MDHSRDEAVLAGVLDALADPDSEVVTLDAVAARAGMAKTTLYRRWATKDDLLIAAVRSMGPPPEAVSLPDRGSLREDLIAVVDSPWLGGPDRRLALFAGLEGAGRTSPPLREVIRETVTEPYIDIYRRLLTRAGERAEVPAALTSTVPLLAAVVPAMSSLRLALDNRSPSRDFYVRVIDDVVLAAVRGVQA